MMGLSGYNPIINWGRSVVPSPPKLFLNTFYLYFPNNNDNSLHLYSTTVHIDFHILSPFHLHHHPPYKSGSWCSERLGNLLEVTEPGITSAQAKVSSPGSKASALSKIKLFWLCTFFFFFLTFWVSPRDSKCFMELVSLQGQWIHSF